MTLLYEYYGQVDIDEAKAVLWKLRAIRKSKGDLVSEQKHVYIFMGVSGSGKSVVAEAIAQFFQAAFLDGDFLHPRANILKMASGQGLNDIDREPWLARVNDAIFAMQRTHQISVIVCSALKKSYRDLLRKDNHAISFIHLNGDFDVIAKRLQARKGHFFKPEMLKNQFDTLELPQLEETDVRIIDVNATLPEVIESVIEYIKDDLEAK